MSAPRVRRRSAAVPGAALAGALGGALACDARTTVEPPPSIDPAAPRVTLAAAPAGDTLHRRGLHLVARIDTAARLRTVMLVVDPGTPAADTSEGIRDSTGAWHFWVDRALTNGRHTFAARAVDTTRRAGADTIARVVSVPDVPYVVTPLPTLGGDADALGINARGDVAGWAMDAAGVERPVVWRGGVLHRLEEPSLVPARALRVNDAGDVLGQNSAYERPLPGSRNHGLQPRVWRADGRVIELGPLARPAAHPEAPPRVCCSVAADLSDAGLAVAYTSYSGWAVFDVATGTGTIFDGSAMTTVERINDAGQMLGGALFSGRTFVTVPMALDGVPWPELRLPSTLGTPFGCIRVCETSSVSLGEGGEALVSLNGRPALSLPGAGYFLHEHLGPAVARATMSRRGGVVVGRDTLDSQVYLMRTSDRRTVRVATAGWRVDRVHAVSPGGAIAAHGVETATGRPGALLLTPAR